MKKHKFKKHLGQNFLIDKNISNKIVDLISADEEDLVIEVGPGSGALTKLLIQKTRVLAYEIDKELKEKLESKNKEENLDIIFDDFLKRDIKKDISKYTYKNLYFISNLPYYITTPIIEKLISSNLKFEKIVIMLQKEVANRFNAKVGTRDYSSITIYLNYYFDINKEMLVKKNSFYPRPNVDSAVISLNPKIKIKTAKDETHFFALVKAAFQYKRKNIKNNLFDYDLKEIEKYLLSNKMDLSIRAEQLSLDNFIDLSDILK